MVKILRSLIHEMIPLDLRVQIELLSRRRDISNGEKQDELFKLLRQFEIKDIVQLGPGTNRYAFKLKGYVIKVATDHDGKIDNLKEFKMAKRLYPYVTKIYEVSENGTLLVAEYIQPFSSYAEMLTYGDQIREILTKLSSVYLIGDVGVTSKNYANWGLRIGGNDPVCLDFAYVYEVSSELFLCRHCKNHAMLVPNRDFTELHCPAPGCGKKYLFEDIRARIGNDLHRHEIGDLTEEGYLLSSSNVETELSSSRSNYLIKKEDRHKKEEKSSIPESSTIVDDNFELEYEPMYYKEESTMTNIDIAKAAAAAMTTNNNIPFIHGNCRIVGTNNDNNHDNNDVVFSSEMSDENNIIPAIVIDNTSSVPNEIIDSSDDDYDENIKDLNDMSDDDIDDEYDEENEKIFSESFIKNMKTSISKISNRIGESCHENLLFDDVKPFVHDKKMYPETFYKNVQNAVFRSLISFCHFTEREIKSENGATHLTFTPPSDVHGEYEPTLIYLERIWINRAINSIDDNIEFIDKYNEMFDDYNGLQKAWLPSLKSRISEKMKIDDAGIEIIINMIDDYWCANDINTTNAIESDDEDEDTFDNDDLSIDQNSQSENTDQSYQISEPAFSTDIVDPTVNEYTDNSSDHENDVHSEDKSSDENNDTYDDDNDLLSVEIFKQDNIIRINHRDAFGPIGIPIYANIDDNIETHIPSMVDDRNGVWDWLIHLVPDIIFRTNAVEKWLRYNSNPNIQLKFAILDTEYDSNNNVSGYIMGVYYTDGIVMYVDDESDEEYIDTNYELMDRLNQIITQNIGLTAISQLKRILKFKDLIHDESYVKALNIFANYQFELSNNNNDDDISEAEQAAIQALIGDNNSSSINKNNAIDLEPESDEEVEEFVTTPFPIIEETFVENNLENSTESSLPTQQKPVENNNQEKEQVKNNKVEETIHPVTNNKADTNNSSTSNTPQKMVFTPIRRK